jgi:hypothetical protein
MKSINKINSADIEWFGGEMENESGRLQYSAVHAWVGDETLCGATPRGEITDVSHGNECKRCLKKVAKIEQAEEHERTKQTGQPPRQFKTVETNEGPTMVVAWPYGWKRVDMDKLIYQNTGFSSLDDLLNARGGYRPSCDMSRLEMELIADAYDAAQTERGDERRAYRYGYPTL